MNDADRAPVWVDKDGIAHYNGDPAFGEEWQERALLGFATVKKEDKQLYALKLKNALSGRAWTMTHKKEEIQVTKLMKDCETDPQKAVMMVLEVVRAACEKVAPIRKNEAFDLFFERGFRKPTEAIQDYINRREREYEQLKSLSPKTNVTSDLLTYFLLRLSGIDKTQQRLILGQCGNEFDWERVTSAMLVQLDTVHLASSQGPRRGQRPRCRAAGVRRVDDRRQEHVCSIVLGTIGIRGQHRRVRRLRGTRCRP